MEWTVIRLLLFVMSHTAVYMHFNLLNTKRHRMYDAPDRWALLFDVAIAMVTAPAKPRVCI